MEINFVYQVRSFHRYKRENALSANAQALWLELFGLFNARRFPEEMPVSTLHLCTVLNISKDTVLRARKELEAQGMIETERGKAGRGATIIRMHYFENDVENCPEGCGKAAENCGKAVDNHGESCGKAANKAQPEDEEDDDLVPEDLCGEVCVAKKDANCVATKDAKKKPDFASQQKTQKNACVAGCVEICDPYQTINPINVDDDDDPATAEKRARDDAGREAGRAFRKYLGRPITDGERETLMGAEVYDDSTGWNLSGLVDPAVHAAVRCGAKSPALYAARVLGEWKGKHIHTGEQGEAYFTLTDRAKQSAYGAQEALQRFEETLIHEYHQAFAEEARRRLRH